MPRPNGVHHLAIATADIRSQIDFFTDVLGMELVALYWMHGVQGAWHGFLRLNDQSSIAFVQSPAIADIPREIGKTHSGSSSAPCAGGAMQHLALNVDSEADLLAMRDRIRSRGVNVLGHIDHGFCKSIYFAGPENLSLEISTSEGKAIDPRAWIDPEVVRLAGISEGELSAYCAPEPCSASNRAVAQPAIDPAKPHMVFPPGVYERVIATPDADIFAQFSEIRAPVAV